MMDKAISNRISLFWMPHAVKPKGHVACGGSENEAPYENELHASPPLKNRAYPSSKNDARVVPSFDCAPGRRRRIDVPGPWDRSGRGKESIAGECRGNTRVASHAGDSGCKVGCGRILRNGDYANAAYARNFGHINCTRFLLQLCRCHEFLLVLDIVLTAVVGHQRINIKKAQA